MARVRTRWLTLALTLAACSPGRRERVTLATVHLPALGLVFIAESKGYFAQHGLTVEQRRFSSGRDALAALLAGEVDAATSFETPVVLNASRDPDLEVVTTLHVSNRSTRVVARADRGIASEVDLARKRIGVARNTNAEYFLHTLLAYGGVPAGGVTIVDVAPDSMVGALASGEVDAIAIWPPHADRARAELGAANTVEIGSEVYTEVSLLLTRDPVHQKRRGALVRLVAALADAERLVRERPGEAFDALRSAFPALSEAELRDAWSRVEPALGLTHQLAAVLEDESEWFRAEGRIRGPPLDLGNLLDPDVLAQVDAEAVTFVPPPRGKAPM